MLDQTEGIADGIETATLVTAAPKTFVFSMLVLAAIIFESKKPPVLAGRAAC